MRLSAWLRRLADWLDRRAWVDEYEKAEWDIDPDSAWEHEVKPWSPDDVDALRRRRNLG